MVTDLPPPKYDPCGGSLCLDFANSVSRSPFTERFQSYADVCWWSEQAGSMTTQRLAEVQRKARGGTEEAAALLQRARALREVIFRVFTCVARAEAPDQTDLQALNLEIANAQAHARVEPGDDGFHWVWAPTGLDAPLWPIARSAAELLTSAECQQVRECSNGRCRWLFVDRTRNHSKRWCDMKVCGNRAKVRKHRRLQRDRKPPGPADPE